MPPQRLKRQMEDAVAAWASAVFLGNVPVIFSFQDGTKPAKPYVELNIFGPDKVPLDDQTSPDLTMISGARLFTASIKCRTDANPKPRKFAIVLDLTLLTYRLTLGGFPFTQTYLAPPVSQLQVLTDLSVLIVAGGYRTWIYGQDPSPVLVIEPPLPNGADFSVASTANMQAGDANPGDAFDMAGTLQASLNDQSLRTILYSGGVGAGPCHPVQDLTQLLETKFERLSQFDVRLNAASNQAASTANGAPYQIDTVTPPAPTWQP
jgi:hypothetical protein